MHVWRRQMHIPFRFPYQIIDTWPILSQFWPFWTTFYDLYIVKASYTFCLSIYLTTWTYPASMVTYHKNTPNWGLQKVDWWCTQFFRCFLAEVITKKGGKIQIFRKCGGQLRLGLRYQISIKKRREGGSQLLAPKTRIPMAEKREGAGVTIMHGAQAKTYHGVTMTYHMT